jgi:type I restriction enzyme, S subunit
MSTTAKQIEVERATETGADLPEGWAEVKLAEVGVITTGNTPPRSHAQNFGTEYPWVKPPDLDHDDPIEKTDEFLSEEGASKARVLASGSVMVSCIGNLGKVGIAAREVATNQQINSITFSSGLVNPRYGYYFCKTLKDWLEQNASATTIPIINKGRFTQAPFLLAPAAEQERIAGILARRSSH